MLVCKICSKECSSFQSINLHVLKAHDVKYENYLIAHEYQGIVPPCKCGCGQGVGYFRGQFREYLQGHFLKHRPETLVNTETREKRKRTCVEKYGGNAPACSERVQEKTKQTCLLVYGKESPLSSDVVKEKIKTTLLRKYGTTNIRKLGGVDDKIKETNKLKYGAENVFSSALIKDKIKNTNIEKYGFGVPTQNIDVAKKISDAKRISFEKIVEICDKKGYVPSFRYDAYAGNRQNLEFTCIKHGIIFYSCIFNVQQQNGSQCPKCKKIGTSLPESEIYNFILNECAISDAVGNTRAIISPKELDIFIPSKNIGIEFHGLYWHSEANENFTNRNLHYEKFLTCKEKGVRLFQFYEDEWRDKRAICESMLRSSFGIVGEKINARNCTIVEDWAGVSGFLKDNHLQGSAKAIKSFALFLDGAPVACMSLRRPFTKKGKCVEMARLSSRKNLIVRGGFSKLLKACVEYCKKEGFEEIMSYSDCRYSDGNVYETCGFNFVGHTGINYYYTDLLNRFNRFKFRAKLGKSEKECSQEAGVYKIYGAGNYLWKLPIK